MNGKLILLSNWLMAIFTAIKTRCENVKEEKKCGQDKFGLVFFN